MGAMLGSMLNSVNWLHTTRIVLKFSLTQLIG